VSVAPKLRAGCGTDIPSGDVAVTGVFNPVPQSGGAWRIENPTLCAL
jgi:hypothetical protein